MVLIMSRLVCSCLIFLFCTNFAVSKEVYVSQYFCKHVEYKIEYTQDEQRKSNKVKRAEYLNRKMRKLKKQLKSCRELGYLK